MKDYSAMSDFEINKAVAILIGGFHEEDMFEPEQTIFRRFNNIIGKTYAKFDPCNNPADAWPIIADNKINIDHRESIKAGVMATKSGNKEIYAVDSNPLRAAMIVYLQMMEQKS